MKHYKIIIFLFLGFLAISCDLDENPPFLDDTVYENTQSASATLDGIYQGITTYGTQEQRLFTINGFSGFFTTGKNGNNLNNANNQNLFSLKPNYDIDSQSLWGGLYAVIARCNSAIANINVVDAVGSNDEEVFNDIAGHAYFVRAWSYFSLVRLFGDIPLWLELPSSESLNKSKAPAADVYAQIITDATMAISLMNGASGNGYPQEYAANMLLAKVYMTLATDTTGEISDTETTAESYWQMAYTQARTVYGQYTLVADYASLFDGSNENSSESIFELQASQDAANSQMGRNFTPWKYKVGQHFGWFRVSADFYDDHAATYPEDPRLAATFLSEYSRADTGGTVRVYPANASRGRFAIAHPYHFKFAEKDKGHSNQYNSQNVIVYRYADLLIMLAEISNELQNGEQLGYVTELLARVGMTPHAAYSGDIDSFRNAIMDEYRYELLGEGEDAHNNRRRGVDYFLEHTILRHNNNSNFKASVDIVLSTDPSQIMNLLIPLTEINTNELITN